jgi:serine-type D-Ala-D-Ala carboxypeptidase/endopeptidase
MFRIITALLFTIGIFSGCHAQITVSQEVKDNIKQRVDNGTNPGIVIGVVNGDKTEFYSYGVKSLATKEPVDERSVFEIGSITKTFTGILLADQVIKGKMSLDDPLQKYLPDGITAPSRNGAAIKLVNLTNHTSSLPRMPGNFSPANPANPFADYSEKQMYDFLKSYELPRDIGSQYEYSNYAAGLLGHVLATWQGKTYEALMIEVIANPLGMQDTRTTFTPTMKKNLAMGHSGLTQVENWDLNTLAGAGGIRSNAIDMLKYVRANTGNIKSKLYPAMQLSHKNSRVEGANPIVGLGWHTIIADDREIVWHNGGTGGYRSFVGFIKGTDKGVVVLTNSIASVDDIALHLLNPKSPLKEAPKDVAVDTETLQSYVGKYELAPGFILTVTRDGNQLKVQATGQDSSPVYPKAKNVFFSKVVDAELTFNQKDGAVESVVLRQGGRDNVAKRIKE